MHLNIRRAAILLWVISLVLPALRLPSGELVLGYQLIWRAMALLAMFVFMAPFVGALVACLLTNVLFVRELASLTRAAEFRRSSPNPAWVALALALNVAVPIRFTHTSDPPPIGLPGLTALPGYYSWVFAFVLLLVASLADRPHIYRMAPGLVKRLVLLAATAAASAVLFGGLALVLR
jgi:hypothetical protein